MAGRPSKRTPEVEADLPLLLAHRVPTELAARSVGVSPRSVRRWLAEGDLRERVAEVRGAERTPADEVTAEARAVVLLLRSGDWRRWAWWLERRWPERWGRASASCSESHF